MKACLVLLLALLLAGCNADNERGTTQQPPGSETTTETGPPKEPVVPIEPPLNSSMPPALSWTGCVAWAAQAGGPASTLPDWPTPPGWEWSDAAERAIAGASVLTLRCDRVSFGSLERGPLTLMLEDHNRFHIPAKCTPESNGVPVHIVLGSLYVDDAELAAALAQAYGMPTRIAHFTDDAQDVGGGAQTHRVTWSVEGGETSELQLVDDGTGMEDRIIYRYFWASGNQLFRWEIDAQEPQPVFFTNRVGQGTIKPPMMMAEVSEDFAGLAQYYPTYESTSSFLVFNDFGCEEPVG